MSSPAQKTPAWKLLAALVAAVAVLVTVLYFFLEWQKNRPVAPVREVSVQVVNGAAESDIPVYTVCELDAQCDGGQPPSMPRDDTAAVTVTVPREISSSSWKLLAVYDDPAANAEQVFQSGESTTAEVDAVVGDARLVVAEVSALAIDTKNDGEEIPVIATWSVAFE
ncbi:DUF2771 family protein [Corynebacterium sp. LK2510]|uniref:DUF2771 family protein n=1 Tax=Corynebacterium sp. LK2510 TaxID=3110472 RepID=UPI0034CD0A45